METRAPVPATVDIGPNLERRASLPSTEGSLSPAPSHDNLLSASSSSLQAHQYPERPGSTGLMRSHSGSPLISPSDSSSSAFVYPGRIDTGDRMAGAGYAMDRLTGAGERDVASHASRYGYEFDPNEQTPTQAGPSRWREAATSTPRTSNAPARSLDYRPAPAARAPALPSRHGSCELCALVEQCRVEGAGRTSGLMWERRSVTGRDVLHADDQITVYEAQGKERMTRPGKHLVVVINIHADSVYQLGPVDVPLLSHMSATAKSLLSAGDADGAEAATEDIQIGFVGTLVRDPMSPHTHLHAQAIAGPIDTSAPGSSFWRRNVVFAGVNWYSLDDLRAEIREETSNNRVKSGYEQRKNAPIDHVPAAGSIAGPASALDAQY